jgi:hypothetical protein
MNNFFEEEMNNQGMRNRDFEEDENNIDLSAINWCCMWFMCCMRTFTPMDNGT